MSDIPRPQFQEMVVQHRKKEVLQTALVILVISGVTLLPMYLGHFSPYLAVPMFLIGAGFHVFKAVKSLEQEARFVRALEKHIYDWMEFLRSKRVGQEEAVTLLEVFMTLAVETKDPEAVEAFLGISFNAGRDAALEQILHGDVEGVQGAMINLGDLEPGSEAVVVKAEGVQVTLSVEKDEEPPETIH